MKKVLMTVGTALAGALTASAELKTAESFTIDDYVTNDLIMWYDGIANVGKNVPQDKTATTWQDLADDNHSATLTVTDASKAGSWTDLGYALAGGSYFTVAKANAPTFGAEFTVQLALDAPLPAPSQFVALRASTDFAFAYVWGDGVLANWKTDDYAGGSGTRPNILTWDGRYWSGAFDETTCTATKGTSFLAANGAVVKTRSAIVEVPSMEWTFGGRATAGWNMTGEFYGLRVYSRKLTDAELMQNRLADDARFHGVLAASNVVVAASAGGLAGTEAPGGYYLVGTHTLTAPDCVQDDAVWEAYGYTLQTWDAANARWGEPVVHEGNSCALDAADITTSVRLAWNWRLKSGIARLDARAYVQDGLILAYDGIENNPSAGTAHDADAAVWGDLSGHGYDAEFGGADVSTGGWTDGNAYAVNGASWIASRSSVPFGCGGGSNLTIQIYGSFTTNHADMSSGDVYPNVFNASSDFSIYHGFYTSGSFNLCVWKTDYYQNNSTSTGGRPSLNAWDFRTINAGLDEAGASITDKPTWDGRPVRSWGAVSNPLGWSGFSLGGAKFTSLNGQSIRYTAGKYNAVRLYSHKLTNAELAHNACVDNVRFRQGEVVLPCCVQVCSSRANAEGVETGAYLIAGSHTFTATNLVTDAGSFAPAGCWVETWDATARVWGNAVYHAGTSCTLSSAATAQRLTWCWTVNALRTAADYTIDDYVQHDMLLWFDGISNAGKYAPHSADAVVWQDLASSGRTASLIVSDAARPGCWTETAYSFDFGSYFLLAKADAPVFGSEFTVQFAIDMPLPNTVSMVPLRSSDDFSCAFVWADKQEACWKTDPYNGGVSDRPDLNNWDGRYWSGALDATSCCATFGTSFLKANGAAVKTRQEVKDLPSIEWTFGGRASAGWNMQGRYFALRAYSRKLTDAELLQNRKADEARFYNRLYVTNVVVAADSRGLKGAEPPEAYEIEGSWTFTAAPQQLVVDRETVTYTPSGYVLETLENGVWSHPERFSGASCTLSGDNAVRRLTWRWRSDRGTMIILR